MLFDGEIFIQQIPVHAGFQRFDPGPLLIKLFLFDLGFIIIINLELIKVLLGLGSIEPDASELLFVESAIALDKPCFYGLWDSVLLISARKSLRLERNKDTARRDSIQSFDPSKVDVIVRNDGSREALYKQLDDYLQTKK